MSLDPHAPDTAVTSLGIWAQVLVPHRQQIRALNDPYRLGTTTIAHPLARHIDTCPGQTTWAGRVGWLTDVLRRVAGGTGWGRPSVRVPRRTAAAWSDYTWAVSTVRAALDAGPTRDALDAHALAVGRVVACIATMDRHPHPDTAFAGSPSLDERVAAVTQAADEASALADLLVLTGTSTAPSTTVASSAASAAVTAALNDVAGPVAAPGILAAVAFAVEMGAHLTASP